MSPWLFSFSCVVPVIYGVALGKLNLHLKFPVFSWRY